MRDPGGRLRVTLSCNTGGDRGGRVAEPPVRPSPPPFQTLDPARKEVNPMKIETNLRAGQVAEIAIGG